MTNAEIIKLFEDDFRRTINEDESGEASLSSGYIEKLVSMAAASLEFVIHEVVNEGNCEICKKPLREDSEFSICTACTAILVAAKNEPVSRILDAASA